MPGSEPISNRYVRQAIYRNIGEAGQRRLVEARVLLVGCGGLGNVLASLLVRAGVGYLRIVDRDVVEIDNLHRQILFDEHDVAQGLPKAEAARRKLVRINSEVIVEAEVADVNPLNIERLAGRMDLLLDGTDNFETRYLVNDVAVKHGIPWVYAGAVEDYGSVMPIVPGSTPCLRCVFPEPPPPGDSETCETVGVLGSAVAAVASFQATEAIKILTGRMESLNRKLLDINVWTGRCGAVDAGPDRRLLDCPCCGRREFEFLAGRSTSAASLCGQHAIQITASLGSTVDLARLAARVRAIASSAPVCSRFMLKFKVDRVEFVVFPDGRAIIKGIHSPDEARGLYARYVGT